MRGYIKVYRWESEWSKGMPEEAYRLYYELRGIADWDKKHIYTVGSIEITEREIQKNLGWSLGKVSNWRKWLIENKFIKIRDDKRISIINHDIFTKPFKDVEQIVLENEINFLNTELSVYLSEQNQKSKVYKDEIKMATDNIIDTFSVQENEHAVISKETLNKNKENINNSEDLIREKKSKKNYHEGITHGTWLSLKKKYGGKHGDTEILQAALEAKSKGVKDYFLGDSDNPLFEEN